MFTAKMVMRLKQCYITWAYLKSELIHIATLGHSARFVKIKGSGCGHPLEKMSVYAKENTMGS